MALNEADAMAWLPGGPGADGGLELDGLQVGWGRAWGRAGGAAHPGRA